MLALAALGFSWFALVAVMTEAGFAGNQRYLMVTTAAVSVLGGVGAVRVLQGVEALGDALVRQPRARARAPRPSRSWPGIAIASPTIVAKADNTGRVQGGIEHEAYLWHDLKALIDANGGKERLLACGGVFSGPVPDADGGLRARGSTASTWAGRSRRRRAWRSARGRCRTARS